MRSAARLTYERRRRRTTAAAAALPLASGCGALYGAFAALDRARDARGALALDLPEHQVVLDAARRRSRSSPAPASTATG